MGTFNISIENSLKPTANDYSLNTIANTKISVDLNSENYENALFSIEENPSNGTTTIKNSILSYTPSSNYKGVDSLKYKITINNNFNIGVITINIE